MVAALDRTYLVVNHFPRGNRNNGINSYIRALERIGVPGWRLEVLANDGDLDRDGFRAHVRDQVTARFNPGDVIVEAAENGAPTLALPRAYRVHIRLHTPHALLSLYRGEPIDTDRLDASLEVIRRAGAVSSPSYALVAELAGWIDLPNVHVFKNPPPPSQVSVANALRPFDILFMGRNDAVKGFDFLQPLLERLPATVRAVVCGRDSQDFKPDRSVPCDVQTLGLVSAEVRAGLMARSKLLLLPSRFENCSMSVLESLAAGTQVVAWDRGGTGEIAPAPLIRLAPFGDVDALAACVRDALAMPPLDAAPFRDAVNALDSEFRAGVDHVLAQLSGDGRHVPFRGISHAALVPGVADTRS